MRSPWKKMTQPSPSTSRTSMSARRGSTKTCSPVVLVRLVTRPAMCETAPACFGVRASNSSTTRGRPCVMSSPATPPVWNVRIVSWVPGSPIDWAATMPTASPTSEPPSLASDRP